MAGDITLVGLKDVERSMKALAGFPEQKQLIQSASRKAARIYINAAKANIPRKTGELRRSMGTKNSRRSSSVIVGPRRGGRFKGYHAHLFEDGFTHKSGRKVAGRHVLRRTWQSTSQQVMNVQIQEIGARFNKYAEKALKR